MAAAELVDLHRQGAWENYHKTGVAELKGRWALRSGDAGRGRDDIAQAAARVRAWLLDAKARDIPVRPVGGAWSPSNIQLAHGGWMLNTRRFNRCFRLAADDFADNSTDPDRFLLVEGGVQIDEINDKLESDALRRSLRSTGASNGQTLAGACATGTHGSVLGAGGIQDHVRALQIVTPAGIFWIEPAAALMSDDFIAATGPAADPPNEKGVQTVRDDNTFAAALVHVGSLGIVTAIVIESDERFLVRPFLRLISFTEDDLQLLADGNFRGFSDNHGLKGLEPYFVMVVTNPIKPFKRKAVVRFLYREAWRPGYEEVKPEQLGAGYDSFTMLGWLLRNFPWARGRIIQTIMELTVGRGVTEEVYGTWGQSTEIHKPLADIFTGALFVERGKLVDTFKAACEAFARGGGSTVMTLRFMKGGDPLRHGLLSPAKWPDTAGLDCDGPRGDKTEKAYLAMLEELERRGIDFTCHWGKFNNLTPERVARAYRGKLDRWKRARDRLLPDAADRRLFATDELRALGLFD